MDREAIVKEPMSAFGTFGSMPSPGEDTEIPNELSQLVNRNELIMEAYQGSIDTYGITDSLGQLVFHVAIEFGTNAKYYIFDVTKQFVMVVLRPFKWCGDCVCCAEGCAAYPGYVYDSQGHKLGMVKPMNYCAYPIFGVFDNEENQKFSLQTSTCPNQSFFFKGDIDYKIMRVSDGSEAGCVSKIWGGLEKKRFNYSDTYRIEMGHLRDVNEKALVLAATIVMVSSSRISRLFYRRY
ncbi:phospholipid scramblase [Plakobranchus ocellatus]|uniref:Phospholipid scramblase n=1 Tax=Plakobranchus ocellatus TaxID=259542 RepID=A0AAV3Z532_9GAST|nr:phospholipid scramblase [Plakobranchus ocellatus]